jgi:hypothetical protein
LAAGGVCPRQLQNNFFSKENKMKSTKMLTILVLALGLMVWPASVAEGAQSLTVNGEDVNSITLEVGQPCTVEVVSDDTKSYEDYVGFDSGVVRGTFLHVKTMRAAGDSAFVTKIADPFFYGHGLTAAGKDRRAGVHFVFKYEAQQVGETDLKLYANNRPPSGGPLLDSVHITVIPLIPEPMGTAFTYQGSLNDGGSPADGLYDLEFKLYSKPWGIQEGNTIDINDLDVIEGQFAIELDFGSDPSIFGGDARWLQVGVRPGDSNDPCEYTILEPRVELTPIPYAIYAQEAAYAQGATDLTLPYSGTISSGTAAFSMTNMGTGYAGNFEQTGASNSNGGLNVTTAAGRFGAKILNQGGYSGLIFGLRADAISTTTNSNAYGGYFRGYSSGSSSEAHGVLIEAEVMAGGGTSYGIKINSDSTNGKVYGVYSEVGNASVCTSSLYGIRSWGIHSGTSGDSIGISSNVFGSDEGDSYGIYSTGWKYSGDTAGAAYGGYFQGNNDSSACNSYGIYTEATGPGEYNYGIYAAASGGTWNYAGYFDGRVMIKGTTSVFGRLRIRDSSTGAILIELGEGLDYAEGFDVSESTKIDAGSVLIIDSENPGKLAISDKAYDSKVAGIAAGAKGMGSGVRLGSDEFDCDVALAGRVYCNVDATEAAVQPGDLLTTPGKRQKRTNISACNPAIDRR